MAATGGAATPAGDGDEASDEVGRDGTAGGAGRDAPPALDCPGGAPTDAGVGPPGEDEAATAAAGAAAAGGAGRGRRPGPDVRSEAASIGPAAATSGERGTRTGAPISWSAMRPGAGFSRRAWTSTTRRTPLVGSALTGGATTGVSTGRHQRGGRTSTGSDGVPVAAMPCSDRRTCTGRAMAVANRWAPAATLPRSGGRGRPGRGPGRRKWTAAARPTALTSTVAPSATAVMRCSASWTGSPRGRSPAPPRAPTTRWPTAAGRSSGRGRRR